MAVLVFFELKYIIPLSEVYNLFGPIHIYFYFWHRVKFFNQPITTHHKTKEMMANYWFKLV